MRQSTYSYLPGKRVVCALLIATLGSVLGACIEFPQSLDPQLVATLADIDTEQTDIEDLLDRVTDSQRLAGCKVEFLPDGPTSFDAMIALIAAANDHINAETWAFDAYVTPETPEAHTLLGLLKDKLSQGVKVNIIIDPVVQCLWSRGTLLSELQDAGANVRAFSTAPRTAPLYDLLYRQHKKLIIVDGRQVMLGDINFGVRYIGHELWRSTNVLIEGPIVSTIQRIFLQDWRDLGGHIDDESHYLPRITPAGDFSVRAIDQRPVENDFDINAALLVALRFARQRVDIEAPYFNPSNWLANELLATAARGVDVRILTNADESQNQPFSYNAAAYWFEPMLAGGVRIFLWSQPNSTLHSKSIVVDNCFAMLSTHNSNLRSIMWDTEIAVIFTDATAVQQARQMVAEGFDHECVFEIDQDWIAAQPFGERLLWQLTHGVGWIF
ncbi:MAG: phosphatidylserine/phosphatidylglycerophosphate/cardiolipin synthase family protein [Planctomycetota bacterium]